MEIKNAKEEKGITLVALIVSIIILIILAAITIKAATDFDIVKVAIKGTENYAKAQVDEEKEFENIEGMVSNTIDRINDLQNSGGGKTPEEKRKVANEPKISGFNKSNTYYVTWDLTSSPYAISEGTNIGSKAPSDWYDYTAGVNKWANIKTTGGGNDCYFVWIPRYAYKVPSRSTAGTIEVKFLEGTTNKPLDGTNISISNNTQEGSWNVSPAFWWDKNNNGIEDEGEQLEGIWVAKFEASSSSVSEATLASDLSGTGGGDTTTLNVRVIPNVTSWRGITINNMFTVCRNLEKAGNSLEGGTNVDSHMMKNSEWGAVAYLSRSVYGKNGPVWNNPYYNGQTYWSSVTGLCGGVQDALTTNLNDTYKYNEQEGENASTTGNVYGVYDMAGGTWTRVACYLQEVPPESNYLILANAENKYKDKYAGSSSDMASNYALNTDKYGDAMYEVSNNGTGTTCWDADASYFMSYSSPCLARGNGLTSVAGVFSYCAIGAHGSEQDRFPSMCSYSKLVYIIKKYIIEIMFLIKSNENMCIDN